MVPIIPVNSLGTSVLACASAAVGCTVALATTPHILLLGSAMLVIGALGYVCQERFSQRCQVASASGQMVTADSMESEEAQEMTPEKAKGERLKIMTTDAAAILVIQGGCLLGSRLELAGIFFDKINSWAAGTVLERAVATFSSWSATARPWALIAVTVVSAVALAFVVGKYTSLLVHSKVAPCSRDVLGWSMAAAAACAMTCLTASQPLLLGMAMCGFAGINHKGTAQLTYGDSWKFFWGVYEPAVIKKFFGRYSRSPDRARFLAMTLAKLAVGCGILYAACTWAPMMAILSKVQVLAVATQWAQHPAVGIGCALLGAVAFGHCTAVVEEQAPKKAGAA